MPRSTIISKMAVPALVAAGLVLRLYQLGYEKLWLDEAFTATIVSYDIPTLLAHYPVFSPHPYVEWLSASPPLYFLVTWPVTALFGRSEFWLRLPSALAGTATIYLVYRLGRRMFNRRVGVIAAAFLTVSQFHIQYSQEARFYGLFGFTATASFLLLHILLSRWDRRTAGLYIVATTLMLYTHTFAWFIIAAQTVIIGLYTRQYRRWSLIGAALILAYLPHAADLLYQARDILDVHWIPHPTPMTAVDTVTSWAGSSLLAGVYLVLAGTAFLPRRISSRIKLAGEGRGVSEATCILLLWIAGVAVVPFILSFIIQPIYMPKYAIPALTPFFILAAAGVQRLPSRFTWGIVAFTLVVSFTLLVPYYTETQNTEWDEVTGRLDQDASAGEPVLIHSPAVWVLMEYYTDDPVYDLHVFPRNNTSWAVTDARLDALEEQLQNERSVWLVLAPYSVPGAHRIPERLETLYPMSSSYESGGTTLYHYSQR